MYYLYLKTHQITGLKYLGFTSQDPFKYKGSGKYWVKHIKKHGYFIKTIILLETQDKQDKIDTGLFFSKFRNIVESKEYANLIVESGTGVGSGKLHPNYRKYGNLHSSCTKKRIGAYHKKLLSLITLNMIL